MMDFGTFHRDGAGNADPMLTFASLAQHSILTGGPMVPTAENMWDPLAELGDIVGTALDDLLSVPEPLKQHSISAAMPPTAAPMVMPAAVGHEQGPYQHQHQHLSVVTTGVGSGADLQVPELGFSAASSDAGSHLSFGSSSASSSHSDREADFVVPRDEFALPAVGAEIGHNGSPDGYDYDSEFDCDDTGDEFDELIKGRDGDGDEDDEMVGGALHAAGSATTVGSGRRMPVRQSARHKAQRKQQRSSSSSSSASSASNTSSTNYVSSSQRQQHRRAPAKTVRSSGSSGSQAARKAALVPEYEGPLPDSFWDLAEDQLAALSFRDFTKMCNKSKLSKAQVADAKRTRRRIKNRHSARECSTRRRERCQNTNENNQTLQQQVTQLMAEKEAISTQHVLLQERAIELEKSRASAVQSNLYLEAEVDRLTAVLALAEQQRGGAAKAGHFAVAA
jgi:hypothetical protein